MRPIPLFQTAHPGASRHQAGLTAISAVIIPQLNGDTTQWWKLASIISCGTLAGAVIPELVKVFTSTDSRHVKEVVTSAEGAARLSAFCRALWPEISPHTTWASPWFS